MNISTTTYQIIEGVLKYSNRIYYIIINIDIDILFWYIE